MFIEFFEAIRDFTETGGTVLFYIGVLIFVMWLLILERAMYYFVWHKKAKNAAVANWGARADRSSWNAEQIRQMMISKLHEGLNSNISIIQALVALCPLLGLMGTVTGMIHVFEVMAVLGTANARAMAAGVYKATIPTMAGMVAALSGVFANTYVTRIAQRESAFLQDNLTTDH